MDARIIRSVSIGSRRRWPRPPRRALATAGAGAQVASLAAESATQGNPALIGDAVTAAELADGATRAAAHLVRMNLSDSPGDPRRTEVTGLVSAAAEALEEAFAAAAEPEGSAPA